MNDPATSHVKEIDVAVNHPLIEQLVHDRRRELRAEAARARAATEARRSGAKRSRSLRSRSTAWLRQLVTRHAGNTQRAADRHGPGPDRDRAA